MARQLVICLAALASTAVASSVCTPTTLDFLLLNGNANQAVDGVTSSLVDKIIADLAEVGITAVPRAVDKDGDGGFNAEMVAGNFDIVFSEVRAERGQARARRQHHCARAQIYLTPSLRHRRPGARPTIRTATSRRGPRRTRRITR